jgi:hypothetical protein
VALPAARRGHRHADATAGRQHLLDRRLRPEDRLGADVAAGASVDPRRTQIKKKRAETAANIREPAPDAAFQGSDRIMGGSGSLRGRSLGGEAFGGVWLASSLARQHAPGRAMFLNRHPTQHLQLFSACDGPRQSGPTPPRTFVGRIRELVAGLLADARPEAVDIPVSGIGEGRSRFRQRRMTARRAHSDRRSLTDGAISFRQKF